MTTNAQAPTRVAGCAHSTQKLVFAKRKRIRKKTPRELADDAVRLAQDSKFYNLTLDVNNLKQEIYALAMQRSLAETRRLFSQTTQSGSSEQLIRQYFRIYRHGFDIHKREHAEFMGVCMHRDLMLGTTPFGIDMFFEQWRLHTALFQIRLIDLVTIRVVSSDVDDGSCIVQCVVQNHGRLSRATIAAVFPSALASASLMAKLVDRAIVSSAAMRFFVNRDRQVVRLDVDVDMVDAFSNVLGHNPHDVAELMGHAAITDESMIGDVARAASSASSERIPTTATSAAGLEGTLSEGEHAVPNDELRSGDSATRLSLDFILS